MIFLCTWRFSEEYEDLRWQMKGEDMQSTKVQPQFLYDTLHLRDLRVELDGEALQVTQFFLFLATSSHFTVLMVLGFFMWLHNSSLSRSFPSIIGCLSRARTRLSLHFTPLEIIYKRLNTSSLDDSVELCLTLSLRDQSRFCSVLATK